MTDEIENPASGAETVEPSDHDNASLTDYWEPGDDEEPATPEPVSDAPADDEEGADDGQPEDPAAEATDDPDPDEAKPVIADEKATVRLADGSETTVAELIQGRMMRQDYTRKTQDLAERRKALEADAQRIEHVTQTFIDHLSSMIPPEPDTALALRDPAAYTRAKAQHEAAIAQVKKLIEIGREPKDVQSALSEADARERLAEENRRLVEAVPETATLDGRKRFWDEVSATAMDLGFSAEELSQATDHRLFVLAHWARKGMAADKAKAAAKAKAAKAPPVAPVKPGQGARTANKNAEAMRRLSRSGSLRDAMAVDFD